MRETQRGRMLFVSPAGKFVPGSEMLFVRSKTNRGGNSCVANYSVTVHTSYVTVYDSSVTVHASSVTVNGSSVRCALIPLPLTLLPLPCTTLPLLSMLHPLPLTVLPFGVR